MPRISPTNQITIAVSVLDKAGLHAGEAVTVESDGDGERKGEEAERQGE
jgi:hypothetical protein